MGSLKRRAAIAPLVSCLAMLASCANVEKPITFNAPADLAAIKLIETTMATETNMDKLIGYYADDATVLDIYAPGIYKGRDQIYAGFAANTAIHLRQQAGWDLHKGQAAHRNGCSETGKVAHHAAAQGNH